MAAVTFQIFDLLNTSMPFDGDGGVHCILLAEMTAQIFFILLNPHLPLTRTLAITTTIVMASDTYRYDSFDLPLLHTVSE